MKKYLLKSIFGIATIIALSNCQSGVAQNQSDIKKRVISIENGKKELSEIESYQAIVSEISTNNRMPGKNELTKKYQLILKRLTEKLILELILVRSILKMGYLDP